MHGMAIDARKKGAIRLGTLGSYAHTVPPHLHSCTLDDERMPSAAIYSTKLCLMNRRHCRLAAYDAFFFSSLCHR